MRRLGGLGPVMLITIALLGLTRSAGATALDDYVQAPDATFASSHDPNDPNATFHADGCTIYVLNMTSQTWRAAEVANRTAWEHRLVVTVPETVISGTAALAIGGGSNSDLIDPLQIPPLAELSNGAGIVTAYLATVPNQPLFFSGEGLARYEDAIIAYTWDQFLDNPSDATWPLQLPMTKSAVRAMDAVQEFCQTLDPVVTVDHFILTGISKRGWTTWLTAAVDDRVAAIAPAVFDALNLRESLLHHHAVYGFWAPALNDYVAMGIMDRFDDPEMDLLLDIVDPYLYLNRSRMTVPKYVIASSGDQFFLPDSARFYFDDLPGPRYIRSVPNTDHALNASAFESLISFNQAIVTGASLPALTWTVQSDRSLRVETDTTPAAVKLWQATNLDGRDFRLETFGARWESTDLTESEEGVYLAAMPVPQRGFTAWFVEATFDGEWSSFPLILTTEVQITPDAVDPVQRQLLVDVEGHGFVNIRDGVYNDGAVIGLRATADEGWRFARWEGDVSSTQRIIDLAMDADKHLTAVFEEALPQYALELFVDGEGTVDPNGGVYDAGTEVSVKATPADGWQFERWEGDATGDQNPLQVVMDHPRQITAVFREKISYRLTVNVLGQGTVDPNGGLFEEGAVLTLQAQPDTGWRFVRWQGDVQGDQPSIKLVMNSAKTVGAVFEQDPILYRLTVQIEGQGTVDPNGGNYPPGQTVSLTAKPASGWRFVRWEDAATGSSPTVQLRILADSTVKAVFAESNATIYDLTTSIAGGLGTLMPQSGRYPAGAIVQLTATPAPGFVISQWTGTDDDTSTATTNRVVMNGNREVTVEFIAAAPPSGDPNTPLPLPTGCFIATAAFGTPLEPQVRVLSDFRDRWLMTNPPGRWFVRSYYRLSPPIATVIAADPTLRSVVRAGLVPLVLGVQLLVPIGLLGLMGLAAAVRLVRRRALNPAF
ncbi:MAG: hypothetical protein GXY33_07670 [Phycisphaerae bacterium]|nr:hypothetical protein [Phycisphaerae bacterium]